ncbi:hypothetical protein ACWEN6_17475 [Sphaerisporangium sp. NPDC004334]
MKRSLTVLTATTIAATTIAALLTAAPAQAAPKDPLTALKAQLAAGRGVSFTEVSAMRRGGKPAFERKGVLRFGKAGIVASDLTGKVNSADESDQEHPVGKPERTIRIGKTSYVRGFLIGAGLPKGKTWWKQSPGWTAGASALFGDFLNAAEPATLKAMLSRSERTGGAYRGEMSLKDLLKVSPWTRATVWWKADKDAKIGWRLVVGTSGLPQRLTTYGPGEVKRSEIRYTGWGTGITIKPPPAGQVTTKLKAGRPSPLPPAPRR